MSRERMIDPRFYGSESVASLTLPARYILIGLIVTADDHGRGRGSPLAVGLRIFPGGGIKISEISECLQEISREGIVKFYEIERNVYYTIPNWEKYQRIKYKSGSKIPSPPETFPDPGEIFPESAGFAACSNQTASRDVMGCDGMGCDVMGEHPPLPPTRGARRRGNLNPAQIAAAQAEGMAWWNNEVAPLLDAPTITAIEDTRLGHYLQRIQKDPAFHTHVLEEARRTAEKFKGRGDKGGFLTFDWLTKPSNLQKFLDGNYRSKEAQRVAIQESRPTDEQLNAEYLADLARERARKNGCQSPDADGGPVDEPAGSGGGF